MATAVTTDASQFEALLAAGGTAPETFTPEFTSLVAGIYPSQEAYVSQQLVTLAGSSDVTVQESKFLVLVAARGRVADPRVSAWTFTLDGHDFYVLRLGDAATLLYDVYSEQWVEWTTDQSGAWRVNTGVNWVGGQALAHIYGSAVIAGDDTFGRLWFLNPEQPYDDVPDPALVPAQTSFTRIVTGQVLAGGRDFLPCYAAFLDGDNYGFGTTDFVPVVTLETSDDQGRTFYNHGTLDMVTDYSADNPYEWTSLGQIASPGRIFRITDNGMFARISGLEMNDG